MSEEHQIQADSAAQELVIQELCIQALCLGTGGCVGPVWKAFLSSACSAQQVRCSTGTFFGTRCALSSIPSAGIVVQQPVLRLCVSSTQQHACPWLPMAGLLVNLAVVPCIATEAPTAIL